MELLEVSIENLKSINKKLYKKIISNYNYDCVIFVARGSYIIGKDLADFNKVPLLEIFATRKGGKIKKMLKPFLQIIPNKFKKLLREKEFKSNIHEKNIERKVSFDTNKWEKHKKCKNILLVDDSVDTGYSILMSLNEIKKYFKNSNIKVAAINCFTKSKKIVKTDYYLYEDTMLKGPWSNDSLENKKYMEMYYKWHGGEEK